MRRSAAPSKKSDVIPKPLQSIHNQVAFSLHDNFLHQLFQYQIEGFNFFYHALVNPGNQSGVILADQMGLGKTVQVIAFIVALRELNPHSKIVIVCPATLIKNWMHEFQKWLPSGFNRMCSTVHNREHFLQALSSHNCPILIMSYELMVSGYKRKWFNCDRHIDLLVCDEAHRMCNPDNQCYIMVNAINATRRIMITGTPLQNRPQEFYHLLNLCEPNFLASSSSAFLRKFVGQTTENSELEDAIKPIFIRRTAEMAGLPERTDMIVVCVPTKCQENLLQSIVDDRLDESCTLKVLSDLRKIVNGLMGCEPGGKLNTLIQLLIGINDSFPNDKTVIASQSTACLDIIQQYLLHHNIGPISRIDGTTKNRQKIIDTFDGPVMLISARVAGVGLNLIQANRIVIYEPCWNPAVDEQTAARVWRTGQNKSVHVYRLVLQGCLDERIIQRQLQKCALNTLVGEYCPLEGDLDTDELRKLIEIDLTCSSTTHKLLDCSNCHKTINLSSTSKIDYIKDWLHLESDELNEAHLEETCLGQVSDGHISFLFVNKLFSNKR